MARRLSMRGFYGYPQVPVQPYYAPNSYSPFRRSGEEPPEEDPLPTRIVNARGVFSPRGPMASRAGFTSRIRVGGFGRFSEAVSNPLALRERMESMVNSLAREWEILKLKIQAREVIGSWLANVDSAVAGFQTIDNVIGLKRKSINDVLAGVITLDKWLSGMDVARQEIYSYAHYVQGSASVTANLDKLGRDLVATANEYAAKAVSGAKMAATGIAIATPLLLAGAAYLLWKVGLPLLHSYLGGRGAYRGYKLSR